MKPIKRCIFVDAFLILGLRESLVISGLSTSGWGWCSQIHRDSGAEKSSY